MKTQAQTSLQPENTPALTSGNMGFLQRKCACGGKAGLTGQCAQCRRNDILGDRPPLIQTKLSVNTPGDKYEQEADRVAEQVMRMPNPKLQRQADSKNKNGLQTKPLVQRQTEEEDEEILQTKPLIQRRMSGGAAGGTQAPPIVNEVLRSPGRPLDAAIRSFMEPRFGHDFSQVRIHNNAKAGESARSVNARAYTVGRNIVFGNEQYSPGTSSGRSLLAHELTHVTQQEDNIIQRSPLPQKFTGILSKDPDIPPPHRTRNNNIISITAYFGENKSSLTGENFKAVDSLRKFIEFVKPLQINVDTHASTKGKAKDNKRLSDLRRFHINVLLQTKSGGLLSPKGKSHGEEVSALSEKPGMPPAELKAKRRFNRRAEIMVLLPEKKLEKIIKSIEELIKIKHKDKRKVLVIPNPPPPPPGILEGLKGEDSGDGPRHGDPGQEEKRKRDEEMDKKIRGERTLDIPLHKIPDAIDFLKDFF